MEQLARACDVFRGVCLHFIWHPIESRRDLYLGFELRQRSERNAHMVPIAGARSTCLPFRNVRGNGNGSPANLRGKFEALC